MKKLCIILAACLIAAAAQAKVFKDLNDAIEFSTATVNAFSDGDYEEAMNTLKPYALVSDSKIDAMIEQTKRQWPVITINYGHKLDTEQVRKESLGSHVIQLTYIVRYQYCPLLFKVMLYENDEGWYIAGFNFSDKVYEVF